MGSISMANTPDGRAWLADFSKKTNYVAGQVHRYMVRCGVGAPSPMSAHEQSDLRQALSNSIDAGLAKLATRFPKSRHSHVRAAAERLTSLRECLDCVPVPPAPIQSVAEDTTQPRPAKPADTLSDYVSAQNPLTHHGEGLDASFDLGAL